MLDRIIAVIGQGKTLQGITTLLSGAVIRLAESQGYELDAALVVELLGSVWIAVGLGHKVWRTKTAVKPGVKL